MSRFVIALALAASISALFAGSSFAAAEKKEPAAAQPAAGEALNFKVKDIDGKDVDLNAYKGKVVMIINVASKCGYTPQYKGLEALYEKYKDKGFVILGFPANNFKSQEPGTNAEIKEFCTSKFAVTFPLFSKISVKGDDQAPLYKYLTALDVKPKGKGDVSWNFEKFLVDKDGKVIGRYKSAVTPEDKDLLATIEAALK